VTTSVVKYELDDETVVQFEIEPSSGFRPAGTAELAGKVRQAVAPAVQAARVVLEKVREVGPDEVKLKFGIKVSGQANWFVAKAATEGNFEIEMVWKPAPPVVTPAP
jgi:hypothetical protein